MLMIAIEQHVAAWLERVSLSLSDIDCANAVMLKILDGKCKMPLREKQLMAELYWQLGGACGPMLDAATHQLISSVGPEPDESMRLAIYEQRILAETRISRPVMKAFKAMIREQGLLDFAG